MKFGFVAALLAGMFSAAAGGAFARQGAEVVQRGQSGHVIAGRLQDSVQRAPEENTEPQNVVAEMRRFYLNDLIRPHDYAPRKNSFLVQHMHRGDKKTVLELSGAGSVQHIWSTWSIPGDTSDIPAPGRILMRVFVDGEVQPSISGPFDELCKAAELTGTRYVPLPAFNYKGAFNFYLPIFFERGIRIEVEAADEISEFYAQIDYRTQEHQDRVSRLVSDTREGSLELRYTGAEPFRHSTAVFQTRGVHQTKILEYDDKAAELTLTGPGILRELRLRGDSLDDLEMQIYWDDHQTADVDAPLHYFFADFDNAAMESGAGQSTCYFPMPFRKTARIVLRSLSGHHGKVDAEYWIDAHPIPADMLYFRAQYHETEKTNGYEQYRVLQKRGAGLFVGLNLFDSGHNHGGGDAALIDSGGPMPRVLHGICGEDYFGFAWHHFGTMTPLTGAPAHERRYRLHLENPYPFHESFQFLFGIFAGQHPRSVAFWYEAEKSNESQWSTFDIPWKVLGPVGLNTALPEEISNQRIETVVPINEPTSLQALWQTAPMRSGFLDATYQFRHYVLAERGTGFVTGGGKLQMITWLYAGSSRTLNAILGHDDRVSATINSREVVSVPGRDGFGPYPLKFPIHTGWNRLALTVYNDENVNWRWWGISLAFERRQSGDLRFASEPPTTMPLR